MPHRAAIVTALLLERPLCMDCLCEKANMKPVRIKATLANISRALKVRHYERARCRACGEDRPAISIDAAS